MGIPSYYKKLTSSVAGLVSKQCPFNSGIDWLWMDFNCLIYHCLHREDTPPYPGDLHKDEWETEFIEHVMKYTHKVIQKVNPVRGTRICIDGVVPMAKMRQQRLRRFKSSWMTANDIGSNGSFKEGDCENNGSAEKWDTNSITPGTHFMSKLRSRLEKMSSTGKKKVHISSSDEPGEGEHKIMADWRTREYYGNVAVYGLDADLIVLSILNKELLNIDYQVPLNVCLFREEIVSGKIERDSLGEEEFEWFSVNELRDYLCKDVVPDRHTEFILHYCFAMCILGNDFLPSSLGLKIRDDGHAELIQLLCQLLFDRNTQLVMRTETSGNNSAYDYRISYKGLLELFSLLSIEEADKICHYVNKKNIQAHNLGLLHSDIVLPIGDNNYPLDHIEENILQSVRKVLDPQWQQKYLEWFPGFEACHKDRICEDYLKTIQWSWDYYTGKMDQVCYNWYYPHRLPPLWSWLSDYLHQMEQNGTMDIIQNTVTVKVKASDIHPTEQLCIVLSLQSWGLIPDCKYKTLPFKAPQYFPIDFGFDTIGKRFFWECEAEIPLITILELKNLYR